MKAYSVVLAFALSFFLQQSLAQNISSLKSFSLNPPVKLSLESDQAEEYFFYLQGGLMHDADERSPLLDQGPDSINLEVITATPYTGFNHLSLSLGRRKDRVVQGLEISGHYFQEPIFFSDEELALLGVEEPNPWKRTKWAVDLAAYQLFMLNNQERVQVYLGPDLQLGYAQNDMGPTFFMSLPYALTYWRLGAGIRLNVNFQINDHFSFQFGPHMTVVDLSYQELHTLNPTEPVGQRFAQNMVFDLVRSEIYLPVGLVYSWHKS